MHLITILSILGLATSSHGFAPSQRYTLSECLTNANVPIDEPGSEDWMLDIAPFNTRLPYQPILIAVPTTAQHIQDAISCAVDVGVKVTPKSGGHSYAAFGLGGEDGHLVLELDRMDEVLLHEDGVTASIQAGARLGHIATELYTQGGRAISHGTCPGVGIGGHALHGGYGMSSHTYGLALDWITGLNVVLANSTLVHCSESSHPDLFWALRGAGSSFGVVVEFEVTTFEAPSNIVFFQAELTWNDTAAAEAGIASFQQFGEEMPAALTMRAMFTSIIIGVEGLFYGTEEELHQIVDPLFVEMGGAVMDIHTGGWLDQAEFFAYETALDQGHPYNINETFYATSMTTPALTSIQIARFVDYWFNQAPLDITAGRFWWIQMDLHGGANSAVASVPRDATSYAHRERLLLFQLYDAAFAGTYPDHGFGVLQNFVRSLAEDMERDEWGMYINYADTQLDGDVAEELYWGENLGRLKMIKGQVDPDEVFYYPQGVRPE